MKIEITLDPARMQWIGGLGIVLACASCVPSPRAAGSLAPTALNAIALPTEDQLDDATREQVSRKAAEWLVPVSDTPAEPFTDASRSAEDHERSLNCLTAAIYYEARSEPEDGQRAVAQVVLNRVRHPAFPSTVCGAVFQGQERSTGCQFSFTCDGSMRGRRQPSAWTRSRRIAEEALAGSVFEPVGNATHYHTTAIRPYWAKYLHKSALVGAHIFYRWAGNAGEASAFRQKYGGLEPAPALWNSEAVAGITVHRGLLPDAEIPSDKGPEEIALDDGSVTIHRGAEPQHDAANEVRLHREATGKAGDFGVKVHVGTPPAIG